MQRNNNKQNKKTVTRAEKIRESISAAVARTLEASKPNDAFIYVANRDDSAGKVAKKANIQKTNVRQRPKATSEGKNIKSQKAGDDTVVLIKDQTKQNKTQSNTKVQATQQNKIENLPKKKDVFKIDNSNNPDWMPPVLPFNLTQENSKHKNFDSKNYQKPFEGVNIDTVSDAVLSKETANALELNLNPMSADEISSFLGLNNNNKLYDVLNGMIANGELFQTKKKKYALPYQIGYIAGRVQVTSRGYGFLICDDSSEDIFIPEGGLHTAMNGDHALVNVDGKRGDQRSASVVFVDKRALNKIVGTIESYQNKDFLVADNDRIKSSIPLKPKSTMGAKIGQKVVAEFDYSSADPDLKVVEILGDPSDKGMDVLSIIKSHGIETEFPRGVLQSANKASKSFIEDEIAGRKDFREMITFTIDGADAKDFDDAISCEINDKGNYLLGVHIADVSHYVKENSSMDKEAAKRCNSVYVIDKVVPMLPENISNGVCSLQQGEDRLTLSCIMEIDNGGEIISHQFAKSVISSSKRMIYEDVTEYLEMNNSTGHKLFEFDAQLKHIRDLAKILKCKRHDRGSLDFSISESEIKVDNNGKVIEIKVGERGISNSIIEEFMLICNEVVAEHMAHVEEPMIYRIHEDPSDEKQETLYAFLAGLGYHLPKTKGGIKPKQLQLLLDQVKGKPEEETISRFLLKSMQKAKYSTENAGHFGLAAKYYCHFTAPIRRYSDLVVHRIVKKNIEDKLNGVSKKKQDPTLSEVAQTCSEKERSTLECERDVIDLKKAEYMSNFIGTNFVGKISGVTGFGIFIELPNTCEGLVRISDMKDDYYTFDDKKLTLIGQRTRKEYTIGDSVDVRVEQVDVLHRKVDFSLVVPKKRPRRRRR